MCNKFALHLCSKCAKVRVIETSLHTTNTAMCTKPFSGFSQSQMPAGLWKIILPQLEYLKLQPKTISHSCSLKFNMPLILRFALHNLDLWQLHVYTQQMLFSTTLPPILSATPSFHQSIWGCFHLILLRILHVFRCTYREVVKKTICQKVDSICQKVDLTCKKLISHASVCTYTNPMNITPNDFPLQLISVNLMWQSNWSFSLIGPSLNDLSLFDVPV